MRAALLLAATLSLACATVHEERGVPGGAQLVAKLSTASGELVLHRWSPTATDLARGAGERVVVIPELGFDHRLVAPLCKRLQRLGFDVVTFDPPRGLESFDDFVVTVARVVATENGPVRVLAIGVAGEAAFDVARVGGIRGIVAVNVPLRREIGNVALARALADDLFAPARWSRDDDRARLLFGGGHATPMREIERLDALAVPIDRALAADVADRIARHAPVMLPDVPVRLFAGTRDNVVNAEDAFEPPDPSWRPAYLRRLGRMEMFARDYGHLDWLASKAALDDVTPALADALGALP